MGVITLLEALLFVYAITNSLLSSLYPTTTLEPGRPIIRPKSSVVSFVILFCPISMIGSRITKLSVLIKVVPPLTVKSPAMETLPATTKTFEPVSST